MSEEEARQRIAAQLPIEDKVRRADYVVSTEGTIGDTNRRVGEVYVALMARVDIARGGR